MKIDREGLRMGINEVKGSTISVNTENTPRVENLSFTLIDSRGVRGFVKMSNILARRVAFESGHGEAGFTALGHSWNIGTGREINLNIQGRLMNPLDPTYEVTLGKNESASFIPEIERVIYNQPATIIFWDDGTKTVVQAQKGESYDREKGLAMAIAKKALGNKGNYYDTFSENL